MSTTNLPSTTSPAKPDASVELISRLFKRLHAAYGKHWTDMWLDTPIDAVKATWAHYLANFSAEEIGRALEHLPKFPPTLPEFVELCRQQYRRPSGKPDLQIVDARRDPPPGGFKAIRDVLKGVTVK